MSIRNKMIMIWAIVLAMPLFLFQNCTPNGGPTPSQTGGGGSPSSDGGFAEAKASSKLLFESETAIIDIGNLPRSQEVSCQLTASSELFDSDIVLETNSVGSTARFLFQVPDDQIYSLDFEINVLIECEGVQFTNSRIVLVAKNNDPVPTVSVQSVSSMEGQLENLVIELSHATVFPVEISLEAADGTGVWGEDFELSSMSLVVPPKMLSGSVPLNFIDDDIREDQEKTGLVRIASAANGIALDSQAEVTVGPSDSDIPYISIFNSNVVEAHAYVRVEVELDKVSDQDISFRMRALESSTLSLMEYSSTLKDGSRFTDKHVIPAGETVFVAEILITDDLIWEGSEALDLEIYDAVHSEIAGRTATLTVSDPSIEEPKVSLVKRDDPLSNQENTVMEGGKAIEKFRLAQASVFDTRINYQLVKTCDPQFNCEPHAYLYQATEADMDFTSGQVVIEAGELLSEDFFVRTIDDSKIETYESYRIVVTRVESGPFISTSLIYGTGWIVNDDLIKVTAEGVVDVSGGKTAELRVHLSEPALEPIAIGCRIGAASTATPTSPWVQGVPADFENNPTMETSTYCVGMASIFFEKGQSTAILTFPTFDHDLGEKTESAFVELFDSAVELGGNYPKFEFLRNSLQFNIED